MGKKVWGWLAGVASTGGKLLAQVFTKERTEGEVASVHWSGGELPLSGELEERWSRKEQIFCAMQKVGRIISSALCKQNGGARVDG